MAVEIERSLHGVEQGSKNGLTAVKCIYNNARMKSPNPVREMFDNCTAARVRMVARTVSNIYDQAVARHDVTIAQTNLLVALADLGPCAPRKIGEFLQLERSTVSRNLDLLINRGLVEALSSDAKGIREIAVTTEGRRKIAAVLPDWRSAQKQAAKLLGRQGVAALHDAADTIWNA